jgi:hypothetical protein
MTLVLKNLNAHKNMKINKNELLIFRGNLKKKKKWTSGLWSKAESKAGCSSYWGTTPGRQKRRPQHTVFSGMNEVLYELI